MSSETAKAKLMEALTSANAPAAMIELARMGHYDDFESDLTFPIITLVNDCERLGLVHIAQMARQGEFDA